MLTRRNRKNELSGGAKIPAVGSHAAVWHGSAKHTSGGLTKSDLMKNKKGRIIFNTADDDSDELQSESEGEAECDL